MQSIGILYIYIYIYIISNLILITIYCPCMSYNILANSNLKPEGPYNINYISFAIGVDCKTETCNVATQCELLVPPEKSLCPSPIHTPTPTETESGTICSESDSSWECSSESSSVGEIWLVLSL